MVQKAIVKRIVSPEVAEVSLMRQLECGLSCKSCEGCPQKPKDEILALADNAAGVAVGDVVEVESNAGSAIGIAALVYLLPCITLILGYVVGTAFTSSQALCLVTAFAGLFLGFVPAVLLNRKLSVAGKPEFTIVSGRR
ncbi:MAG: SoxR reducing system RseC family protein [Oscillospiraceae bacterium]|nr:SoxR reducing system RseC family protein [Oscillospiraceae bacterium]